MPLFLMAATLAHELAGQTKDGLVPSSEISSLSLSCWGIAVSSWDQDRPNIAINRKGGSVLNTEPFIADFDRFVTELLNLARLVA
ncbi:hypothetical protein EDC56_2909 [Sinobacterium caligoides]|uniref:Uncharacterized protein n=1 Tax=Sinobacterium caligoides TaxID=933926 RepID=A0A3N2DKD9_9GAMM|nr:hypothetical protein EDC56_2909 [Sinobacterium caligoides]